MGQEIVDSDVDPDRTYTNSEIHNSSRPAAHNKVSELNRFVSIVQYEHTPALLPVVLLVALSYFEQNYPPHHTQTICTSPEDYYKVINNDKIRTELCD
jgi:hypothetical protein